MKRVVIVHCWDGNSNYCWYPQTKKELEGKGFSVEVPDMPETAFPKLSLWLPKLKEVVGELDEDLILVGHSAGVITIMRYLEGLEENQKIGGAVFVAGFTDDLGFEELKNFFENPINFEEIKRHCPKFIAIHSDDDPYVDVKFGEEFKEKLGAKVIVKHHMGHFSGPNEGTPEACISLPDVTEAVLELVKNG